METKRTDIRSSESPHADSESTGGLDFIREMINADLASNKHDGWVITRFPPEPNGYLHIGHAKSICLNFGVAAEAVARNGKGRCHLRFDDTNPTTEDTSYVEAMKEDIHWLGFDWGEHLHHASDYFERFYEYAVQLVKDGKAYVDDHSLDEIRAHRGTVKEPGTESPHRNRTPEENLDLLERMRKGEFEDGSRVLRAKIDMANPNMKMRDPLIYRIRHAHHYRTGDKWCIYPFYDYAHCLEDSIERVTHSLCTLEFENNREIYDWFLDNLPVPEPKPRQTEFARLNLSYTVLSKRRLLEMVTGKHVNGWDDPRMPTISGMRRRGYTPTSIRAFCDRIGVAKRDSVVDVALLEHTLREELNKTAVRVMAVLNPLKVVIENYPEGKTEEIEAINNPEDEAAGSRTLPFGREVYIEVDDFMEDPPKKFFRLAPGREVRLKHAYLITCTDVVKDSEGKVIELRCTYDPETRGGSTPDGRRVKGTLHWVSVPHAAEAEVRWYDHLFTKEDPSEGGDFIANINPDSLTIMTGCKVEPTLAKAEPESRYQFLRHGYFVADRHDHRPADGKLVFNRTVGLRDSWAKIRNKG